MSGPWRGGDDTGGGRAGTPAGASFGVGISCRCSVFLLDRLSHELVAKVFDGGVVDDEVSAGRRGWRGFLGRGSVLGSCC